MGFWVFLLILIYFVKIDIIILFSILFIIEVISGISLARRYVKFENFGTYYSESGLVLYFPKNEWFKRGLKETLNYQLASLSVLPLSIIYRILLGAIYYHSLNVKDIAKFVLVLTCISILGEITGRIIALIKEIKDEEKLINEENLF